MTDDCAKAEAARSATNAAAMRPERIMESPLKLQVDGAWTQDAGDGGVAAIYRWRFQPDPTGTRSASAKSPLPEADSHPGGLALAGEFRCRCGPMTDPGDQEGREGRAPSVF